MESVSMILEPLISPKDSMYAGISELQNSHALDKGSLIGIAGAVAESLSAVQLFNPALIVDHHHLLSAAQNAVNAWSGGYARARSLDVEIVVFASGQYQIGHALDVFGVRDDMASVAAVIIGSDVGRIESCHEEITRKIGSDIEPPFSMDSNKLRAIMSHFGISQEEMNAVSISDNPEEMQRTLSRCVVSRVSDVALES
jgi:tRNA threonylcarbamoyladenosine modification (KEOPS) complex Cgi121 subunit